METLPLSVLLLLLVFLQPQSAQLILPSKRIQDWAERFGGIISRVSEEATAFIDIKQSYLLTEPNIEPVDGFQLVLHMKRSVEDFLRRKVDAVERLVEVAEEAFPKHHFQKDLKVDYPKAKKLNTSEFPLEEDEHFNFLNVNLHHSSVHVPTNVYDESAEVLNGVVWSEVLDPYFRENYLRDSTLTWQYFASATGFFRSYPGIKWDTSEVDMYDCRARGWYIQAASSHKDIIILLDTSGSMKGQRLEIAKATVERLVDTLGNDDYFNIIKFAGQAEFIDDCFNRTMVQATSDNKKRLKEHLKNINTENIANFEQALLMAFDLISETRSGPQCNKALMVVTDGVPDTYDTIFKKYNWPYRDVRVFTYLIGREMVESKQLRWMACANKGYYAQISTLADVQEHVQEYIHVLSRPMVINRQHETAWSSVYMDAAGLRMMTSVAQPVFDTRNETTYNGILLGVMGTDVPISELLKLTPQYKLGVNGYAFAVDNNGYVLFHPDFRPTAKKKGGIEVVKTNYNSVDLSEVELALDETTLEKLRTYMLNRKTKHVTMNVKVHHDDMKRVTVRENNYYITEIQDTPFSLGIALPSVYGGSRLIGKTSLPQADLDSLLLYRGTTKIANWNYCHMNTNESREDPVEMLLQYLKAGQQKNPVFTEKCDIELVEELLYDAITTKMINTAWMKKNRDDVSNAELSRRNGIQLVFVGTKSGLTRYYNVVENLTDPNFIEGNKNTIEEEYYKRAAEATEQWIFSVPFNAGEKIGFNHTIVTASSAISLVDQTKKTIAAVAGLQMEYSKFYDFFMDTSNYCPPGEGDCSLSCEGEELECYLLDENGFVLLSKNHKEVGQFFGEIDGTIMKRLIKDQESGSLNGVFEKIDIYDYQGLCDLWVRGASSAQSLFMDPLRKLISGTSWFIHEIIIFLVEFNLLSWWDSMKWSSAASRLTRRDAGGMDTDLQSPWASSCEDVDLYDIENVEELVMEIIPRLYEFGSPEQIKLWRNELIVTHDYSTTQVVLEWYGDLCKHYGPRLVGYEECVQHVPLYMVPKQTYQTYLTGQARGCECSRPYALHPVTGTNLMLLVLASECQCISDPPISVEPQKVEYNSTMQCLRLQQDVYRIRPQSCYAAHSMENSSHCGGCSLYPSSSVLLTVLLLVVSQLMKH